MTRPGRSISWILLVLLWPAVALAQYGTALTGVGPVNRSMGGTATAAPLDTLGALYWNPATITALPSSMDFGLELLIPRSRLSSSVDADSLAPGFPAIDLSGSTRSDNNVFPLPEFGVVYTPEDSALTYGLGVLSVGGFGVNYPGSLTNPLLTPPLPNGMGLGPIHTQYQLLQVTPALGIQVTDRLSVGISPIVNLASLTLDPGVPAAPDNASGSGFPTYPSMNHSTYNWGAGYQLGAYYVTDHCWQFGASFKSTQWFNRFKYNSADEIGAPRSLSFGLDAPMVVSVGTAYTGIERTMIAADARYLAFGETHGYSNSGFNPDGSVSGLGWNDMFAVSAGAHHQLTESTSMRLGYSFSTNPISSREAFFNIGSPLVIQHGVYAGASWNITERFILSLAYAHFFENSVSGRIHGPGGAIPGTRVTSHASADSIIVGASVAF